MEDSVDRVAARIRSWRRGAGLSLQQLANRSGVSPSTIHKIEHGQTVPTIAVVLKLASGLGRRATELFEDPAPAAATHVRACERRVATTEQGVVLQPLSGDPSRRAIVVWRVVHPPGFSFGGRTLQHDDGELLIYLEAGRLGVRVGDAQYALRAGDTLHFEASSPFAWWNEGDVDAAAVILGNATDASRPAILSRLARLGLRPERPPAPRPRTALDTPPAL